MSLSGSVLQFRLCVLAGLLVIALAIPLDARAERLQTIHLEDDQTAAREVSVIELRITRRDFDRFLTSLGIDDNRTSVAESFWQSYEESLEELQVLINASVRDAGLQRIYEAKVSDQELSRAAMSDISADIHAAKRRGRGTSDAARQALLQRVESLLTDEERAERWEMSLRSLRRSYLLNAVFGRANSDYDLGTHVDLPRLFADLRTKDGALRDAMLQIEATEVDVAIQAALDRWSLDIDTIIASAPYRPFDLRHLERQAALRGEQDDVRRYRDARVQRWRRIFDTTRIAGSVVEQALRNAGYPEGADHWRRELEIAQFPEACQPDEAELLLDKIESELMLSESVLVQLRSIRERHETARTPLRRRAMAYAIRVQETMSPFLDAPVPSLEAEHRAIVDAIHQLSESTIATILAVVPPSHHETIARLRQRIRRNGIDGRPLRY